MNNESTLLSLGFGVLVVCWLVTAIMTAISIEHEEWIAAALFLVCAVGSGSVAYMFWKRNR